MGTRRALGVSSLAQAISFGLNLLSVVVVARLLTPSEIGVFSVAISFQAIIHVFREFGVTQYLVQASSVNEENYRAAFSLTLLFSWAIACIMLLCAQPLAEFYRHDGVASVLYLLAVNFFLIPIGTPSLGMLKRELRFDSLAVIGIVSKTAATVVTITAASLGQSYLSMAWGAIAGHVANLAATAFFRPKGFFILPSFRGIKSILRFGSLASAATLVRELGSSAPDLILGRTLGFSAVAYYSRAAGLRDMLLGQFFAVVNGVHFPTFAKAIRSGADAAELYTRATTYLIAVTIPLLALLALLAEPLILFFFGDQWLVAAPLASALCLFGILMTPYALANPSLIAGGHVSSVLYVECIVQSVRIGVLLTSIWLTLDRVVLLLGIVAIIEASAYHYWLKRHFAVTLGALRRGIVWATIIAPLTLLGPVLLSITPIGSADTVPQLFGYLALSGLTGLLGWISGIFLLKHPLWDELINLKAQTMRLKK